MRYSLALVVLATGFIGCDGQDADRLNRVGKKLAEKVRHSAESAHLPAIEVHWPKPAGETNDNQSSK